jgi:cyclic beta-1,2-glucan synthetase
MFEPTAAVENLRKLTAMGSLSEYGFYEAADFTPRRMTDSNCEIVRNWMAHHQGMSLVAAANALCDSAMQRRFHAEPCVSAVERLLHERFPRTVIHEDGMDPIRGAATADPDLAVSGCELGQLIPKPL